MAPFPGFVPVLVSPAIPSPQSPVLGGLLALVYTHQPYTFKYHISVLVLNCTNPAPASLLDQPFPAALSYVDVGISPAL